MYTIGHKIVLLGDSGVGKSSMITWLLVGRAEEPMQSTVGAAFYTKEFDIDYKKIKFNIWDTAGQERFRSIAKIYYRNTMGCFAVFDVTNRASFLNLKQWLDDYQKENNKNNNIIIIANKCDMDKKYWKVTEDEIKNLSSEYDCEHIYTSCVNGLNVEKAFEEMGRMILQKNPNGIKPIKHKEPTAIIEYPNFSEIPNCTQC